MDAQISNPGVYPNAVYPNNVYTRDDAHVSGVSWKAVLAGAATAAALSFILLILGFGLGLSSLSPWAPWAHRAVPLGKLTLGWVGFIELVASGVGGYLAGRLRTKWPSVHTDEVYFRDTAHGLLAWSVGSLVTATLMIGMARVVLGGAIDVGAGAAAVVAPAMANITSTSNPVDYFSDVLLRSDQASSSSNTNDSAAVHTEVTKIIVTSMRNGSLAPEDRDYLAHLVKNRTNLSLDDAKKKVDDTYARLTKAVSDAQETAKQAAETARKATADTALWMFVALLFGAFIASLSATYGGIQRDNVKFSATRP